MPLHELAARLAEEVADLDCGIGVAAGEAVAGNVGNEGALALDSFSGWIIPWWKLDYQWIMRQSPDDPSRWVSVLGEGWFGKEALRLSRKKNLPMKRSDGRLVAPPAGRR